jgi:hypothetical protein
LGIPVLMKMKMMLVLMMRIIARIRTSTMLR